MRKPILTPAQARRCAQSINDRHNEWRRNEPRLKLTLACRALERKRDDDQEKAMTKEVWE